MNALPPRSDGPAMTPPSTSGAPRASVDADAVAIQRAYYSRTASDYDGSHWSGRDEHAFALHVLEAAVDFHGLESIVDVGAGTGRVARHFARRRPDVKVVSVEPVVELREIARLHASDPATVVDGDAYALPFPDGAFDLACSFAVLHHVERPDRVIAEMLRVSRRGVFISDGNNFGQGSRTARLVKQTLHALGLWPAANWIKTRGKGYQITEGDGLAYSYSVFDNLEQLRASCDVHMLNTLPSGANLYRTAPHVAMLALKRSPGEGL